MLVSEATRWSSSPEGGFEQSERLLKRKTMKRIGGLALMAACLGVLTSCSLGPGDRTHGENSGVSRDFSDIKSGGDSAVSGVADVTATGVGEADARGTGDSTRNGVLPPLGEFDRTVPGFKVFDPCVEIPSTSLELLKLERDGVPRRESGYRSCDYIASLDSGTADITLESWHATMGEIKGAFPEGMEGLNLKTPGAYAIEDSFIAGVSCTVFVESIRGVVSVSWSEVASGKPMREKCLSADEILNSLSRKGENNAN